MRQTVGLMVAFGLAFLSISAVAQSRAMNNSSVPAGRTRSGVAAEGPSRAARRELRATQFGAPLRPADGREVRRELRFIDG
jgi:hypothetical protein